MTTQAAIPLKWYVPFATGDASRVEIPVTSSDATRASQTLGFPPLTMQPPAVGGVPPQGEDFNGAMNQVARVAWWVLNGGGWPYDATFATNSNINGYPNGAVLQSADFLGQWINTVDNNQINPDTVGTNWVPGFQYGSTALTGQTGGTTTLTPLQAAKRGISISGTLTSALVVIFPNWLKDWSITNNTTGAFTVIAKTAAGSGVTIPQNGSPTAVSGDGTNVNQPAQNIAPGTSSTHGMQLGQAIGRVLRTSVYRLLSGTQNVSVNGAAFTTTGAGSFTALSTTNSITVEVQGGGGGGGPTTNPASGSNSIGGGGGGGAHAVGYLTSGFSSALTVTVGAGGASGAAGGASSLGALISAAGGSGGATATSTNTTNFIAGGGGAGTTITGGNVRFDAGTNGGYGYSFNGPLASGTGGNAGSGAGGAPGVGVGTAGVAAVSLGAGGSGACVSSGGGVQTGGAGGPGYVIVTEYA